MNKVAKFLRKHIAAVLIVAIALSTCAGVAFAKYASVENVTSNISVTVEVDS